MALPRPFVPEPFWGPEVLYFLSVALVRSFRWTGVTRYGTLWCPDFPLGHETLRPVTQRLPGRLNADLIADPKQKLT